MTRAIDPPAPRCALPRATLLLVLACASSPTARAAEATPWVKGAQSQARLLDGGPAPGGRGRLAGLEIRLQPHFITYWRDPGDAGVPPTFSFAGSTNLRAATPRYPAPRSLDEAGARAFGYEDDVIFPILVEPEDPAKAVDLKVTLDYAACHDICLPAHADLRLTLGGAPSAEADKVRAALAAVPRPAAVGGAGDPAIRGVTPGPDGGFTVATSGGGPTLFVEAPEGWAYEAGPPAPDGAARAMFPVKRLDHPKGIERPPGPLTLTLTSTAGAIEVPVQLDGPPAKP